jgi:hypothetical protein
MKSDREIQSLEKLLLAFNKAKLVCDPFEFHVRQRELLHAVAEHLLINFNLDETMLHSSEES